MPLESSSASGQKLLHIIDELPSHMQHDLGWFRQGHDIPADDIFQLIAKLCQGLPPDAKVHEHFQIIRNAMKKTFDRRIARMPSLTGSIMDRIQAHCAHMHREKLSKLLKGIVDIVEKQELRFYAAKLREAECIDEATEQNILQHIAALPARKRQNLGEADE